MKGERSMSVTPFETINFGNIRLHMLQSDKFKTNTFVALIEQELSEEKVTQTALLPQVLQRGTQTYPTTLQLKRQLDELYGANLFGDVFKRGERHMIQFGFNLANEQYLREKTPLLKKGIQFFQEVLLSPLEEQGKFKEEYVQAEKNTLKKRLQSLQDDKIRYSAKRLTEVMCQDEPFALYQYGQLSDLDQLNAQDLYTYYQEVFQQCPMDFYFVGDVDRDELVTIFEQQFANPLSSSQRRRQVSESQLISPRDEEQVIVERLNVTQGKLNIGCRTQVTIQDDLYPALMLYNGILGGFAHSKLFMNVREKASLAYYCYSRLESHKGLLSIQSGIEIGNYEKAVSIIKKQFEEMQQGNITDQELEKTKATLINQFRERQDSAFGMIDLHHHSIVSGREWPLDELISQLQQTTRDQIQQVAKNIQIDTIYFLRDQGGTTDAKN